MKKITIVGAGLVGSLLSIYLSKKGFLVNVFESRPDIRKENISAGRSINLALSHRGWNALKEVGVDDHIRNISLPMYKRVIHDINGNITEQPYGLSNEAIYSVSRSELNKKLMNFAEERNNVNIHFNSFCKHIELETGTATFLNKDNVKSTVLGDHLFGADGANSMVRQNLEQKFNFSNSVNFINHSYKELCIPANKNGTHILDCESLHIWPRKNFMLIALPNLDGSFTCTLFLSNEGEISFQALNTSQLVVDFFTKNFPDVLALAPSLEEDFFINPTSPLGIVNCYPWIYKDKVALIGDAAHAIVPFYGQGMNAGFEDCSVLNSLLNINSWNDLFSKYQMIRKINTDAISELSLQNFLVMMDKTANPLFLLQKKIERWFSVLHPEKWNPLYSMVTFSNKPYNEALELGKKQSLIMHKVLKKIDTSKNWKTKKTEKLILSYLN